MFKDARARNGQKRSEKSEESKYKNKFKKAKTKSIAG